MGPATRRLKLRQFLVKLGINSAQYTPFQDSISLSLESIEYNFGRPDKMYMDPEAFKQLQKINKDKK